MILLSDYLPDGPDGGGSNVSHHQAGNVTHPFVTQTYRCVDAYETKDTKNRPFKVAVNEKLDVLIKDPAGQCLWFLCCISVEPELCCCHAENMLSLLLQVGGWLRMRRSVWLGFLLPTWSYGMGRTTTMVPTCWEV